jgi:hypothetical protein
VQTVLILIQNFSPGGFRPFFDAESKNDLHFEQKSIFRKRQLFLCPEKG